MKKLISVLLLLTVFSGSAFSESFFKKDATGPFLLNFLVGFGIGSYVQGDVTGGVIGTVGELAPLAIILGTTSKMANDLADPYITDNEALEISKKGLTVYTISAITLLGVRIFECVRPFTFENKVAESIGAKIVDYSSVLVLTNSSNLNIALKCKIDY